MGVHGTKRGETARRIYAVLKREPDLTAAEIKERLPNMTHAAVSCALHKMKKNGVVEVRKRKVIRNSKYGSGPKTADSYHVKYKTGALPPAPKTKRVQRLSPVVEAQATTMVKAKPVWTKPAKVAEPKVAPQPEREVIMMRYLTDIYKSMNSLAEQQEALIGLLKDTLVDLAETKEELDRERERRNWWDKLKGWF